MDDLHLGDLELAVLRLGVQHILVEDRAVAVVPVGAELLHQAQPRRGIDQQVREQVVFQRINHLGHRMTRIVEAVLLAHLLAQLLRHYPARGLALGHLGTRADHRAIGDQHAVEQFLLAHRPLRGRAGRGHRAQVAADVIGKDVVLHVVVTHDIGHLGVDIGGVIGLHEGLHRQFPIARQMLADMGGDIPTGQVPIGEMLRQNLKIIGQRRGLGIEVHHDHAVPAGHLHLGQPGLRMVDLREFEVAGYGF